MGKTLVVVESPAKAKTIEVPGLGLRSPRLARVTSDLPKKMGIDVEKGFRETATRSSLERRRSCRSSRPRRKQADDILLATDPDREGETIAWHLAERAHGQAATRRSASSSTRSRRCVMCRLIAAVRPRTWMARGEDGDQKEALEYELRAYSSTFTWLTRKSLAAHELLDSSWVDTVFLGVLPTTPGTVKPVRKKRRKVAGLKHCAPASSAASIQLPQQATGSYGASTAV